MLAEPLPRTLVFMSELSDETASRIDRVAKAWDRIEAQLDDEVLGAPATEEELDQLEKNLGLALPDEVRASWLRHASVTGEPWEGGWIAPPEHILQGYRQWTESEADGDFEGLLEDAEDNADSEGKWYHEAWIPLVEDFGGNCFCLDTRSGRLVCMDVEDGSSFLDEEDWPAYLESVADLLETTGMPSRG